MGTPVSSLKRLSLLARFSGLLARKAVEAVRAMAAYGKDKEALWGIQATRRRVLWHRESVADLRQLRRPWLS